MRKIALVGNPNSGKTTLFNRLTGLNQKVGNYPGITVDKRSGKVKLANNEVIELIDLPGAYSLSSNSADEQVVQDILLNKKNSSYPDEIVLVVDATNLQRNLFFVSQIIDLGFPVILVVNMIDVLQKENSILDIETLQKELGIPVLSISSKNGTGIQELKTMLVDGFRASEQPFINITKFGADIISKLHELFPASNDYSLFKIINHHEKITWVPADIKLKELAKSFEYAPYKAELLEINDRYMRIDTLVKKIRISKEKLKQKQLTAKIDKITTHPVFGFFTFLLTFFILFQAVFTFAQYPMDWINNGMAMFGDWTKATLGEGILGAFLADGVIAGLGGVLVFVPQIMILFGFFTLLEDSGYLARVSFMTDGLLRKFGMNGKSIVPLVGGFACAIPAIMAARTIKNPKERLITIFITPLMSCSARIPVYVFLVSFIAPNKFIWGFISIQGLVMLAMYALGVVVSLIVALIIHTFMRGNSDNSFILELPDYRFPNWKNIVNSMINKGKTFVVEAGKIIVIASMVLWALSYFGPSKQRERIDQKYASAEMMAQYSPTDLERHYNSEKLKYSYLGYMGRAIEPAVRPLGFDWKIGIALVSSFAAREVFVGSMATIYSVEDNPTSERGLKAIKFSYATAFSLLIFYVFALQCLSTVAIVKQETKTWKIPIIQWFTFTGIAYLGSLITYQLLT